MHPLAQFRWSSKTHVCGDLTLRPSQTSKTERLNAHHAKPSQRLHLLGHVRSKVRLHAGRVIQRERGVLKTGLAVFFNRCLYARCIRSVASQNRARNNRRGQHPFVGNPGGGPNALKAFSIGKAKVQQFGIGRRDQGVRPRRDGELRGKVLGVCARRAASRSCGACAEVCEPQRRCQRALYWRTSCPSVTGVWFRVTRLAFRREGWHRLNQFAPRKQSRFPLGRAPCGSTQGSACVGRCGYLDRYRDRELLRPRAGSRPLS